MACLQAKGSVATLKLDEETTYNVIPAAASRRPWRLAFNSSGVARTQALNAAETLRGDRNPSQPFDGFADTAGDVAVPVDFTIIGKWLKMIYGPPTTSEVFTGSPINIMAGAPTVTLVAGTATFSVDQTNPAFSTTDLVIWSDAGTIRRAYVSSITTPNTVVVLSDQRTGGAAPPNCTAQTVLGIHNNFATTAGTVSIASGVATFVGTTGLSIGRRVIYAQSSTTAYSEMWLVSGSGLVWTVMAANGFAPADSGSVDVDGVFDKSVYSHSYSIHPTNCNPSFVLAQGHPDLTTPQYFFAPGCKANGLQLEFGGDDEFLATIPVIGSGSLTESLTDYDASPSPAAIYNFTGRWEKFDAAIEEADATGVLATIAYIRNFSLNYSNELDTESRAIGGGAVRRDLPEQIAVVTADIEALYESNALVTKATNGTIAQIRITSTRNVVEGVYTYPYIFRMHMANLRYQRNTPAIEGPQGIVLNLTVQAFKNLSTDPSAIVFTLQNQWAQY